MPSPGGGTPSPGGSSPSGGPSGGGPSGGADGAGGAGDVGSIPPPPGQSGGGADGGGESGGGSEAGGDSASGGGGEENPFGDADGAESESECGDTGALPGGIGGMGREGECLSGGSSASESDSESESTSSESSGGGGGASGGDSGGGGGSTGTGGAGSVGEFPEESAEERAERLGKELDESIGGFDETLGEEQREIAAAGRVMEGYDTEGGEEGGGSGGLISLGSQTAGAGGQPGRSGSGSGVQTSPIAGMSQEDITERTPDDIPITVDDDIIARQLREAALVENDPALRDRLWAEYRKYKGISAAN